MKILTLAAAAVVLGLAGAAYAQQTVPPGDNSFAQKAAAAGLAEVAEANIALDKATDPQVKQFAQTMVTDHTKANNQLTQIAEGKALSLPMKPTKRDQNQADKLRKMSGKTFDRDYIRDQLAAHKQAVALFKRESERGKDADLKQFASQTLPTLQHHLQMAEQLAAAK